MPFCLVRRRIALSALAGIAAVGASALVASHARAASMNIAPIPVVITGGATSTMVEITDEGEAPVRVQVTAFDWTQTPSGGDKLEPSGEILVFPSIVEIRPGASRKVRVGTQGGYGATEKSFRLLFAELPSDSSPAASSGDLVSVLTHFSVPLFVTRPGAVPVAQIEGASASKDHLLFGVRNVGSAHALISKVTVEFRGDGGRPLRSKDFPGWYVLPGQLRPFDIPIGPSLTCEGAKSIVVSAALGPALTVHATLDRPACAD
jgi:fimbrial chaperone protein